MRNERKLYTKKIPGKGNLQNSAWFISAIKKDIFKVRGNINDNLRNFTPLVTLLY